MTPEERIAQHEKTIQLIRQDIVWLRETQFSIGPGLGMPEGNTDQLIARQEDNIKMYERFIDILRGSS